MKPLIISVDFDGTLTKENNFPHEPDYDMPMIWAFAQARAAGHILILNTCRVEEYLGRALKGLRERGLEFDYVNENCDKCFMGLPESRKVYADISYDDTSFNWDRDEALRHIQKITHELQTEKEKQ